MNTYQIQSNDCCLQVYDRGNGNSHVSILFLHGGPGSGAQALMDLPAFQSLEDRYHCVYFDQRGAGSSTYDLTQGLAIDDITTDVYLIARHLKQERPHDQLILWGGSFGGCLAALVIERYPALFDQYILSSPAITFSREEALDFFQRMQAPYKKRFTAPQDSPMLSTPTNPEAFFASKEARDFIFSQHNPSTSIRHICAMAGWFYAHSFAQCLKELQKPTLILQGTDDDICIYQNIDRVLKEQRNPNITYVLYEHCGHAVFEDQEAAFVERITSFIEEQ